MFHVRLRSAQEKEQEEEEEEQDQDQEQDLELEQEQEQDSCWPDLQKLREQRKLGSPPKGLWPSWLQGHSPGHSWRSLPSSRDHAVNTTIACTGYPIQAECHRAAERL